MGEDYSKMDEPDKNGAKKVRTMKFCFEREAHSESGDNGSEKMSINVPLLALVEIPMLGLELDGIIFDMEVNSSESTPDKQAEHVAMFHTGFTVEIKGFVTSHEMERRVSDDSEKHHIQLYPKDCGTAEGLARVLDMLNQRSTPTKVEGEQDDVNGISERR